MDQRTKIEKVSAQHFRDMLKEQGYKCALSDRELKPTNTTLDHTVPLCRGGHHVKSNTQLLDVEVNRAKGSLTDEEFIALCRDVVETHYKKFK